MMQTLQNLWHLAAKLSQQTNHEPAQVFGHIGLFLDIPLTNHAYNSTPANSSTFASTGGDGVHYGLLHVNGEVVESSPVVMTVPCAFGMEQNLIVGNDLHDFLCLGYSTGYFNLEQLIYQREEFQDLESTSSLSDEDAQLLQTLIDAFDLQPWNNIEMKLQQLNEKYLVLLQLPTEP